MILLAAGWVLPIGAPPIRNGRVAVEQGRVTWVGMAGDSGAPEGPVRTLGAGVLMPGLVNAHCHLELSYLRGRLPRGDGFVPWVESVVLARGTAGEEQMAAATAAGVAELKECGTIAVAGPVIWFLAAGESAKGKLDSLRGWLVQNNAIAFEDPAKPGVRGAMSWLYWPKAVNVSITGPDSFKVAAPSRIQISYEFA